MRTIPPKQTLLSCLSNRLDGQQDLNLDREESTTQDSEETLLPDLTSFSETSEIRKWPKSMLFTKSCKLSKRQTLMNMSDKQLLMTMLLRSTSLMDGSKALNNGVNMQRNWLESAMRESPQENQTETGHCKGGPNERNQMMMRLADFCKTFEESSQESTDIIVQLTLLTWMMAPPQ